MNIKKAYVDIADGQIHYYEGGDGDTPIIFLHQNTSGGKMFLNTMATLLPDHRCIAFDLPGFGGSFEPPEFDSISALTTWTLAAIDALAIERFHVFGCHTGAGMAAELGTLIPDRVASVMMLGPLLLTPEQAAPYREQFSGSAAPDHDARYLKETWDYLYRLGGDLDIAMMNDEFWQALRAWRVRGAVYRCVWDYPFDEFIKKLNCPVLLLSAPDDVLYPAFLNTKAALPAATAVEVKGANFETHIDPEGVGDAVRAFLRELA
jgi:haloalkane dehalogenase